MANRRFPVILKTSSKTDGDWHWSKWGWVGANDDANQTRHVRVVLAVERQCRSSIRSAGHSRDGIVARHLHRMQGTTTDLVEADAARAHYRPGKLGTLGSIRPVPIPISLALPNYASTAGIDILREMPHAYAWGISRSFRSGPNPAVRTPRVVLSPKEARQSGPRATRHVTSGATTDLRKP
jgi:hypothetical protein